MDFLAERNYQQIYVFRRDALRRGLLNEENAWRRALLKLAGERTALALT